MSEATTPVRSSGRILTTHAGSLPHPKDLVELYAKRAGGEIIDDDLLLREAAAATRAAITKQLEVGIDIPNNGEQAREAFFLS